MSKLQNKVALITGGTTGIGLATAKLFAAEGARVIVTGRNPETLANAEKELAGKAQVIRSDAADLGDVERLFESIQKSHGRLDVLFLNAGIAQFAPLEHVTEELLDSVMTVNFKGPYFAIQKALPLLGEGASVVLNSTSAVHIGMGTASVYTASKAALASLTRSLAVELAPRGVRINTLSPGPIETPIYGKLELPQEAVQGFAAALQQAVAFKRIAQPDEMARVALFLASDDASFVTGHDLVADGGVSNLFVQ